MQSGPPFEALQIRPGSAVSWTAGYGADRLSAPRRRARAPALPGRRLSFPWRTARKGVVWMSTGPHEGPAPENEGAP
jgi:hypothetical protein